jgi:hypothetical protein
VNVGGCSALDWFPGSGCLRASKGIELSFAFSFAFSFFLGIIQHKHTHARANAHSTFCVMDSEYQMLDQYFAPAVYAFL